MPLARVEAVHLGEDLVERLFALVAAARRTARAPPAAADGVELVDEDDRRRGFLGLTEQVAHPRGADADDHLDELRGRHREERHACLARHRARQQRLAGARRPAEEDAMGHPRAEALVPLRIAQEVDDLRQLVLDLVDAGHVVERDRDLRGVCPRGLRAAQPREPSSASALREAPEQQDQQAEQEERGEQPEHEPLPQRRARLRRPRVDGHVVLREQPAELSLVRERRHVGVEALRPRRVLVIRRVANRAPQLALHARRPRTRLNGRCPPGSAPGTSAGRGSAPAPAAPAPPATARSSVPASPPATERTATRRSARAARAAASPGRPAPASRASPVGTVGPRSAQGRAAGLAHPQARASTGLTRGSEPRLTVCPPPGSTASGPHPGRIASRRPLKSGASDEQADHRRVRPDDVR